MANQPTVTELQALILQLQTQVQALENAATAAPIVQAAPAAAQVVFADTPQILGAKDLINYLSKWGSDIYKQGIAPLDDKALTNGFNMTAGQTVVFTEASLNRATAMGWNKRSKQITTFNNSSGVAVDIIKCYGQTCAALMDAMANLDMNKWGLALACMYHMLVVCMAGPMDTGQEIATYLLLHLIPIVIYQLVFLAVPEDPMLLRI
jgi:hypothetical protein